MLGCRHFNSGRYYDICTLHDFTRSPSSYDEAIFGGQHSIRTAKGKVSVELLEAMRGMVFSIFSGRFQGNLNPRNMWICVHNGSIGGHIANLTNRTLDCNWNAPEQHLGGELTSKTDLFTLGCIIFYCITGGIHPFGEDLDQHRKNVIQNNPVNLSQLKDMPEAYHLISRLLNPEPKLRPNVRVVVNHPLFWSPLKRLKFLVRIWEKVFSKDIVMDEDDRELLSETLKKKASSIADPKWGVKAQCIEERCDYLVQLFYDRCPRSDDKKWIHNSFPPLLDLQDVVGPRRSRTSGYYQRLLVNTYEAILEVEGVQGWYANFWWV